MGMPVCSHCTSFSLLTELFTAQMERDPALYNSPNWLKQGKRRFNHRNLQTVSLFTFGLLTSDYNIYFYSVFYTINKLCLQASSLFLLLNIGHVASAVIKVL